MNKKLKQLLLSVMLMVGVFCVVKNKQIASANASGDFFYDVTQDNTANIYWYVGADNKVVVPDRIDGYVVTQIGSAAFENQKSITFVKLPNTVVKIGERAFANCDRLEVVTIPEQLEEIATKAFYGCTNLKDISLPGSLSYIGKEAFYYCRSLTTLNIPGKVEHILDRTFLECNNLKTITLNEGTHSVGEETFGFVHPQVIITIPKSVNSIFQNSFFIYEHMLIKCYNQSFAHKFAQSVGTKFELFDPVATSITLNKKTHSMNVFETVKLNATVKPDNAHNKNVIWKTSNSKVATVSSTGTVKGITPGTVKITATTKEGSLVATCTVTIKDLVLNKKSATLYVDQTTQLNLAGTTKQILWSSSNAKVASVTSKGKVTAKTAGTAKIYANVDGRKYTSTITVKNLSLNKTSATLYTGQTLELSIKKSTKKITWSTSNKKVATISSSGKVTAKATGSAKIYASVGGRKYTCSIVVKKSNLTVSKASVTMAVKASQTVNIQLKKYATKTLKYEIADKKIVSASLRKWKQSTAPLKIKGQKKGTTTITIWSSSNKSDKKIIKVTVK